MSVTIGGTSGVTFNGGSTLNPDNTMPSYACRAWVNFNGQGTTGTNMTIRAAGNVTSVLKNGTGDYTITFTTSMPDANYAFTFGGATGNGRLIYLYNGTFNTQDSSTGKTAASIRVLYSDTGGVAADNTQLSVAIFR